MTNSALVLLNQDIRKVSFKENLVSETPLLVYALQNKNSHIALSLINKYPNILHTNHIKSYVMTYLLLAIHYDLEDVAVSLVEQ